MTFNCVYCLLRDGDELTRAVVVFRGHPLCRAHLDTYMKEEQEQLEKAKRRESKPRVTTGTSTSGPGPSAEPPSAGGTFTGLTIEAEGVTDETFLRRLTRMSMPVIPSRSPRMDADAFTLPGPLAHVSIDAGGALTRFVDPGTFSPEQLRRIRQALEER